MGRVIGGDNGLSQKWAVRRLKRLFPQLGDVEFESSWHGRIAMTPDHLPRIHRLAPNLYTPIGYNGRGIAPGTMFGKAMGDLLTGGSEDELPLPISDPKTVASAPVIVRGADPVISCSSLATADVEYTAVPSTDVLTMPLVMSSSGADSST